MTRDSSLRPNRRRSLSRLRRRLRSELLEPRQLLAANLVINEFMASNANTIQDENGDSSDWIEVFNPTATAVDLTGWALSDNDANLDKWVFPNIPIQPSEYLVVFASDKDRSTAGQELHTNFKLSSDGEFLALSQPDQTIVSQYAPAFPAQSTDVSFGLIDHDPNQTSFFSTPSPGEPNQDPIQNFVEQVETDQPAGFYDSPFTVTLTSTPGSTIRFTTDGSTPSSTHGTLYTDSIAISSTTNLRAIATMDGHLSRPSITRTYVFLDDVLNQSPNGETPTGFPSTQPGEQIYDYGIDPDIIAEVGIEQLKEALLSIPTWSITTDFENLFDQTTGIYANAAQDGRQWERPA